MHAILRLGAVPVSKRFDRLIDRMSFVEVRQLDADQRRVERKTV
jgi:hypothetical protein